jgi:type II secretory pathway pseudopilin PulG
MFLQPKPKKFQRQGFTLGEVLVSFLVFTLAISGLIFGYVEINRMAEYSAMSLAAQSFAEQGLEEAKSVPWSYVRWPNTNANSEDPFWTPPSVGGTNLNPQVDTLDVPTTGLPILVTNFVSVSNILTFLAPSNPPMRQIWSACVWTYPWNGQTCTNTAVALRAPDQ